MKYTYVQGYMPETGPRRYAAQGVRVLKTGQPERSRTTHSGSTAIMTVYSFMTPRQTTNQQAEHAKTAKPNIAEGDALRDLSKIPGVLEEGIITVHTR